MKYLLLAAACVGSLLLISCQSVTPAKEDRPAATISEVDAKPQKIAPTSL